jgi:lysyl endopeptidase
MNNQSGNKYFQPLIIVLLMICLDTFAVHGQLSRPGRPYPLEYKGSPKLKVYDIIVTEEQKTKALKVDEQSLLKPAQSGLLVDVQYSPENSGTWDTLPDGTAIWRAAFNVKGASMINLVFSPYQLNKGARIFLFDRKQKMVLGAFTDLNNKPFKILATAHIPGDVIIVEIQVPQYRQSLGLFSISGIGCDFSNSKNTTSFKDGWFGESGACNTDIKCINDSLVRLLKNAVVRIVFNGTERCTGTLVNNTQQDGINYVLTAEHCISKETEANTAVYYFDYESPYCDGPDGSIHKSLSGSTIRATGDKLDFTLLELLEPVPFTYQPYYAGWDYSGYQPASGFIIHHPLGDVKKFSKEDHPLSIANFGQGYNNYTHWLVSHWEKGTTEKGSSGGAFFDAYGRIVGTLSGGLANCVSPDMDYFQMFSHSWDDYPAREKKLASWLDPLNQDKGYLEGFDPFADFRLTGDTLSNILPGELLTLEAGTLAWGSYSGHNSGLVTGFAEKFSISGNKKMPGLLLYVAKNYVTSLSSTINVKVWSGAGTPDKVLIEMSVPLADLVNDTLNFIEFDSIISVSGIFFAGYELEYNAPQDTFATYMVANRLSEPVNSAFVYDGSHWQSLVNYTGGQINSSFAIMPVIFDSIPESTIVPKFDDPVIAFPSPAGSHIWLEFHEMTALPLQVTMFNLQGQLVLERNYGPYQRSVLLQIQNIPDGIYIIKVSEGNQVHNLKVAIIK